MFRKIVLSIAALGLMAAAVAPLQASPPYRHEEHRVPVRPVRPVRAFEHRVFHTWGEANAWMAYQRGHGFECYSEWHGPQCFIYYR
jgi:hypothetical protein